MCCVSMSRQQVLCQGSLFGGCKVMNPALPYSSATSHFNMETLKQGDGSFDGEFQNGQLFMTVTCRQCDDNRWTWVMEDTDVHSDHLELQDMYGLFQVQR